MSIANIFSDNLNHKLHFDINQKKIRVRFSDRATWGKGKDRFKVVEEEMLERFLKYSFVWDNITTTNKYTERFKDFLRHMDVNWKGDLQFTA